MTEELPPRTVDWKLVKRTMAKALLVLAALSGVLSFQYWGWPGVAVDEAALLCLALGFWITEQLVAVFTRTRVANVTAIMVLFLGKVGWWVTLVLAAKYMPSELAGAVGMGIGAFLLAVLVAMLRHYGMPRISEGNPPPQP